MRNKTDTIDILEFLVALFQNKFSTLVKCLRTDNAKELCEGRIMSLYQTHGTLHQRSCTDSPQQNGVVEQKHRHLLETARALFFQSRIPSKYWGECLLTATRLINRMPLSCLGHVTPYEKLYGKTPSLQHLKVFGCLIFASTIKTHRTKFDSRVVPCVFIGYPTRQRLINF